MSIDMNHTRHAPGQAVKPCPQCGGALVDTSDGVWAHAIGVEPCGWRDDQPHAGRTRMTEADLDKAIRRILRDLPQLMAYHTYDSRRSASGWPDLVIARISPDVTVRDDGAVMFRELKRQDGKVSPAQEEWIEALRWAGLDVGVWRPSDLLTGDIARELAALAGLTSKEPAS